MSDHDAWPALPYDAWRGTFETLHMWTQIVGKTRLALVAPTNHTWHTAFQVTARGLATLGMPCGARTLDIEFDLVAHELLARTSDGARRTLPLAPLSVADFYEAYMTMLHDVGVDVAIWPVPTEIADGIPFAEDRVHEEYDADAAARCGQILRQADRVLQRFRGRFVGKASPVHFFWGAFDLAYTRFSGRTAPPHPGGVPALADRVVREAYSHEVMSVGWWPGSGQLPEPAFYAYAYPEPAGFASAAVRPDAAYYHSALHEFVLPYEQVRTAEEPDATLLAFVESAYAAAANLAGWDRAALERPVGDDGGR